MTATVFEAALNEAMAAGYVARLPGRAGTMAVKQTIQIAINSTTIGPIGIDGGGRKLVSEITDGSPVLQITVGSGVVCRYLKLGNFAIMGNGKEGDGLSILADGNDRWLYNWTLGEIIVENVGGNGIEIVGSIFEGTLRDCYTNSNGQNGARFAHSAAGGQVSAIHWTNGGARQNAGNGISLENGARDLHCNGAYFVENKGSGLNATNGISSVADCGFENNGGAGITFQCYANLVDNTFSTGGVQKIGVEGYLAGDISISNCTSEYYGPLPDPTCLAQLNGNGSCFVIGKGLINNTSGVTVNRIAQ